MSTQIIPRWTLLTLLTAGCSQSDFGGASGAADVGDEAGEGDDGGGEDGPGDGARDPDDDVSCASVEDCSHGEVCQDGVCQMPRCQDDPYSSSSPLGPALRFAIDQEIVVADNVAFEGAYYVDGYAPGTGSIEYPGSWAMGATPPVDVVGGDFMGRGYEVFAVAASDSTAVIVRDGDDEQSLEIGFQPFALGAGDVDHDKRDELVVLGQFGNVALCEVEAGTCSSFAVENGTSRDLTVADVDGDGFAEPVLLLTSGDTPIIYVWNTDAATTDQQDFYSPAGHEITRIDGGDLDGDGTAELVAFEDDGWISSAQLYVYSASGGAVVETAARTVDDSSRDLALADVDRDRIDEVFVLREQGVVELLRPTGDGNTLMPELTHQLQVSTDPIRIAASDFDGDSPRAVLVDEQPTLISGPIVPQMVIGFPPYDAEHSTEVSSIRVGSIDTTSERLTDTVSLAVNVDVGVSANLFEIFKVGMSASVSSEVQWMHGTETSFAIGDRHTAEPDPSLFGSEYGVVVVTCGCFHAYTYEVEDPQGHFGEGGDAEQFVMLLPVGGTTTVWSTPRYNAMAAAVGGLPQVEIAYQLGDPESYPRGPERADGSPVAEQDFVFPEVPDYLVSDVAKVGWELAAGTSEVNGVSTKIGLKLGASLGIGPVQFGAGLGANWGHAYELRIGEQATFGGAVPPIPDDPATPEDEYVEYAFSFSPYVYQEHYVDADGNDAAYYVMSYAVGER
ncbi:MAG: hypothetical protein IAG13_01120 [Deltaproteobacteria bacterium]|nr:hypothetical protein [Nannocystaceae bacterium]